jgi:Fic family protein
MRPSPSAPPHNYYLGRPEADITGWIGYFIGGMATSFEKARGQALREAEKGGKDQSRLLRYLDARQRKVLTLFQRSREIAAKDVARRFGLQPRTAALLCQRWAEKGFLETTDPAKKSRRYKLGGTYAALVDEDD